ncbi:LiaI-LiaF-like domain-containing protein [Bacillus sp. CGMCC 1.16607]|uniref:LiaI-LiaF-like domain-containing protein n=1 Tax=Bacillus sp. CGMCC 1.16607 TaxID=3351842 RepID=UPI003626A3FB
MKNQRIFPGMILIGFGAYFYLQQSQITLFKEFYTWPTLLIIVGIAFLGQAYIAKDYDGILPGTILLGFGVHFHVVHKLAIWPDHIGTFILIIALGFLLRYQKLGVGLFQGLLFLALAGLLLFYDKIVSWIGVLENRVTVAWKFWPAVLILIGIYLLLKKETKKRQR